MITNIYEISNGLVMQHMCTCMCENNGFIASVYIMCTSSSCLLILRSLALDS